MNNAIAQTMAPNGITFITVPGSSGSSYVANTTQIFRLVFVMVIVMFVMVIVMFVVMFVVMVIVVTMAVMVK